MSSTIDYRLTSNPELLDIIDEEWLKDTLPVDPIPLPEGLPEPLADELEDPEEHVKAEKDKSEKWTDLGW